MFKSVKKFSRSKLLLQISAFTPLLYFALLTVLGYLWDGYNPITTGMSEVGALDSPYQNFMNFLGFAPLGFSVILFGTALYSKLQTSFIQRIVIFLTVVSGIFLFLVAFFPCDAGCVDVSTTGSIHSIVSTIPALLMPIAAMLSANLIYKQIDKTLGYLSFWFGFMSLISGPLMFISYFSQFSGAIQRLGIGFSLAWMTTISTGLLTKLPKKTSR